MDDLSTVPGVTDLWPSYTAPAHSSEYVSTAIVEYMAGIPGVRSVYKAKPMYWDDNANFFGSGQPFGVGAYLWIGPLTLLNNYTGNGKPERLMSYEVALNCLFRSNLNDAEASLTLQRRIHDEMIGAIRSDPSLGGSVWQAGVRILESKTAEPETSSTPHEVNFIIQFSVEVNIGPGE